MGRSYDARWEHVRDLGIGGQGRVTLVRDTTGMLHEETVRLMFADGILNANHSLADGKKEAFLKLRRAVMEIVASETEDPDKLAALKVLHEPADARDAKNAAARIESEINMMSAVEHPNLLKIRDSNGLEQWFVSEYHTNGALSADQSRFAGDVPRALRAFRPLVDGVKTLHDVLCVHRDIKPANIFISNSGELILGDFGLVHSIDAEHARLSEKYENVGSRDWMPPWAMGKMLDKVRPNFDVFSLGKLLWSMVSGKQFLLLWYYDRDEHDDVEKLFPERKYIHLINPILAKCVVEEEDACLPTARELLAEVDQALEVIENAGDRLDPTVKRKCKVCGIGTYELRVFPAATDAVVKFGLVPAAPRSFLIFSCDHCRHVQLFECADGKNPPAWNE